MTAPVLLLLLAVAIPGWWRETNSRAASARAAEAFAKKQHEAAVRDYERAREIAPSARAAFNAGTANVAAGRRERGAEELAEATADPSLRADAYFNRGNGALAAKAWDYAVRDYADALRADPRHAGAKRNLEIALARREQQRRAAGGGRSQPPSQGQKPQPEAGRPSPKRGGLDQDALLRSVQQQEQEELRRMKARAGQERVGW